MTLAVILHVTFFWKILNTAPPAPWRELCSENISERKRLFGIISFMVSSKKNYGNFRIRLFSCLIVFGIEGKQDAGILGCKLGGARSV